MTLAVSVDMLSLRRDQLQTPARPGSPPAAYGDRVAAVARSGPGRDAVDRGPNLDLDVDRGTSERTEQPHHFSRRVASGFGGKRPPLLALDAAATVRNGRVNDGQHEAQPGTRHLAELGGLAKDPLTYRGPEVAEDDVSRSHGHEAS
jgi:hypothetical protein